MPHWRSAILAMAVCIQAGAARCQQTITQWVDTPVLSHIGTVTDVSDEGVLQISIDKEFGSGIVRLKLWRAETDPWILRFLLLDRKISCQEVNAEEMKGKPFVYGVCLIHLSDDSNPWPVNRFITDLVRTQSERP